MAMVSDRSGVRWRDPSDLALLGYASAQAAIRDSRGRTVRCTPRRRTVMLELDRSAFYIKHRARDRGAAELEWANLERLASLGIRAPEPVFLARSGSDTALGMAAVAGRPVDALVLEAARAGELAPLADLLMPRVSAVVRTLHDAGCVFRDLYWNHVFLAEDRVALIDAERMFEPRSRMERWVVKDLAGLLSSWPGDDAARVDALFAAYGASQSTIMAARAKAARIRAHTPKFSG